MELIYPINFVGHDEWLESGYAFEFASGEVVTRDGEILGTWRAVGYDPDPRAYPGGGRFEFLKYGHDAVSFTESFGILDARMSRGLALSTLIRRLREWHDQENP